jgi:hypothetical protein
MFLEDSSRENDRGPCAIERANLFGVELSDPVHLSMGRGRGAKNDAQQSAKDDNESLAGHNNYSAISSAQSSA